MWNKLMKTEKALASNYNTVLVTRIEKSQYMLKIRIIKQNLKK